MKDLLVVKEVPCRLLTWPLRVREVHPIADGCVLWASSASLIGEWRSEGRFYIFFVIEPKQKVAKKAFTEVVEHASNSTLRDIHHKKRLFKLWRKRWLTHGK